jgi:hypothetical protein
MAGKLVLAGRKGLYRFADGNDTTNFANGQKIIDASTGAVTAFGRTTIPAGGTAGTGYTLSATANFGVFFGSGVPTLVAAQGSLYLRSDGTTTNDRAYINTTGSNVWTALTTAA